MMHWTYTAAGLLIPALVAIACFRALITWRRRRLSRASSTEESPLRAVFHTAAAQSTLCGGSASVRPGSTPTGSAPQNGPSARAEEQPPARARTSSARRLLFRHREL